MNGLLIFFLSLHSNEPDKIEIFIGQNWMIEFYNKAKYTAKKNSIHNNV